MKKSEYVMCYFHIGDLVPESSKVKTKEEYEAYYKEPGTLKARYVRYLKTNLGKKNAFQKMMRLIDEMEFVGLRVADEIKNWDLAEVVKV